MPTPARIWFASITTPACSLHSCILRNDLCLVMETKLFLRADPHWFCSFPMTRSRAINRSPDLVCASIPEVLHCSLLPFLCVQRFCSCFVFSPRLRGESLKSVPLKILSLRVILRYK